MNPIEIFNTECKNRIESQGKNEPLLQASKTFMEASIRSGYSYNFKWMGRPIIQYPQDMIAVQEIIWNIQPDLIIETGIAHGGSLIYYASLLELTGNGEVLGIDIDIREHNRAEIEKHPMFKRISMIEGSAVSEKKKKKVKAFDTIVENLPANYMPNQTRPWGPGNNPMTAVDEFLSTNKQFSIDKSIDNNILISVAPRGYLIRTN